MLVSLEGTRDVVIIGAGSLAILAFAALFIFTVVLGLTGRALLGTIKALLHDDVSPLVKSAQGTVHRVQGTATFVSETAVKPIIRVTGIVAGTQRAFSVLSGLSRRRRRAGEATDLSELEE